jgi:phenylacetate-CoA ligase
MFVSAFICVCLWLNVTSLAIERAEQSRWRLLPGCAGLRWFDQLVENEFLPPAEVAFFQSQILCETLRFAAAQVPFYGDRFRACGLNVEKLQGLPDLARLPVLGRADLQEHFERLKPAALPAGCGTSMETRTSGSTGQRVRVVHADASVLMINILKQRESRWFRYDPMGTLAVVRHPSDLPRREDGALIRDGETVTYPAWRYVGNFFHTGSYLCFNDTNPVEQQLGWLKSLRPAYLTALASHLEHLALAWGGRAPPGYLDVILSIAQQLTPAMEQRIRLAFGAAVNVNYGLNEVGIVATRCPEGGRYHVHSEFCLVEIVRDDGKPAGPGEPGRLLVTALKNPAMPLIRYDSGDIAEAVEGPCPCGRTMAAFAGIRGRYRRMAYLPPGTWDFWVAFQWALGETPPEETRSLRQYQLHHYRDGRFELRLDATGALPATFEERVLKRWRDAARSAAVPELRFVYVERIPKVAAAKFENFTSDFFPPRDGETSFEQGGQAPL